MSRLVRGVPKDACPCSKAPLPHYHGADVGTGSEEIVRTFLPHEEPSYTLRGMLLDFHHAMGVPILPSPQVPPDDRVRLRARLIVEECLEFLLACFPGTGAVREIGYAKDRLDEVIAQRNVTVDLSEAADALADIAYVVEGANLEFGIDSGPVLDEVHRANMAKANGPRRADGKILKPEGWTPPDIAGVLEKQK